MNILPKKRWHVRTKENIARVRKDEAEAAEKERLEKLRIESADREARLRVLKNISKQKLLDSGIDFVSTKSSTEEVTVSSEHINLFTDLDHAVTNTNKDHDREVKEKKEEYEKKIGYLTYLGQDTNEALKKKNWYEVSPSSRLASSSNIKDTYEKLVLKDQDGKPKDQKIDVVNGELDWKSKQRHDPMNKFKQFCSKKVNLEKNNKADVKKCKSQKLKDKTTISSKEQKLQKLREIRLKREQQEKYRTEMFLSGQNKTDTTSKTEPAPKLIPKYNSQFNPELARQNYR